MLRNPQIDQNVSTISAQARVRHALSQHQRKLGLRYGRGDAERAGIIMVGRDIGTEVLPEAPLKIYLDATAQERAARARTAGLPAVALDPWGYRIFRRQK